MPNTSVLSLPYPALSAAPNVPQDIQNLAAKIDAITAGLVYCTSTTRPASPTDGLRIYETDTKLERRWDTTQGTWLLWPPPPGMVEESTTYSTTSTVFSGGATTCDISFTAGPTGKIRMEVAAFLGNSSATGTTYVAPEIRLTNQSGTVAFAATEYQGVVNQGATFILAQTSRIYTGLTPGQVYFVRLLHRVGSGTGTIYTRRVIVTNQPS